MGGCAVGQKHDAEGEGVPDSEGDGSPYQPLVAYRVGAAYEATVEEEDGDLGASTADQERPLSKPHAQHQSCPCVLRRVPDVAVSMCVVGVHYWNCCKHQASKPAGE